MLITILITAIVLTALYIALAVVGLVFLGRRLRGNPQLAKAALIIIMGGSVKEKEA